jgi:hypothetical protein
MVNTLISNKEYNMRLDEAKQILKNNGYLLSERDMDDIDYAEMYESMVADEFEKIILKIKKNLNKELPGTEIDTNTFEVKYEGFSDLNSVAKVSCSISFLLPKEETKYLDEIEDTEYEKEYERIWNIAKTDIEEINDNWYYDADWKDGRDCLKIKTICRVEDDEIIW